MVQSNISHFIFSVSSFIKPSKSCQNKWLYKQMENCNNQQTSNTGTNQTHEEF